MRVTFCIAACFALAGCASPAPRDRDVIYQTASIAALLEGFFDGEATFADVLRHGDFGLGTFNALDGEMIAIGGRVYRVDHDGRVNRVPLHEKTPFSIVTFFDVDHTLVVTHPIDYAEFQKRIDARLPSRNEPYAIRVEGEFDFVRTRSVPRQRPPYRRLVDAANDQNEFEMTSVSGVMVGFWFPQQMSDVNVPGYHFHFPTDDRTRGGHVLDARPRRVTVAIDETSRLSVAVTFDEPSRSADLDRSRREELEKIESGKWVPLQ